MVAERSTTELEQALERRRGSGEETLADKLRLIRRMRRSRPTAPRPEQAQWTVPNKISEATAFAPTEP
jgi:hypothetical protein